MSCWGSRNTRFFECTLQRHIGFDDCGVPESKAFGSRLEFYIWIWKYEFTLNVSINKKSYWTFESLKYQMVGLGRLWLEWSYEKFDENVQYSGDYTEATEERRQQYAQEQRKSHRLTRQS